MSGNQLTSGKNNLFPDNLATPDELNYLFQNSAKKSKLKP
jgi:hypothetical protein